ncbi:sulfatase-like hydrolase/transferase [Paraglaciecola aquimarina]|uniref:Sulfatase-like hydrolase/transferase n=1 Tax=Paraglaciecola aquimarina TaxID=1235557 RepID=A0ABU3SW04_9ALTE|nr:sulfatase-like hydrolase/transferase [Paraglaciecola aquimarina]MDU0354202.1 sulfatase-like hydrolase/transferase [Paraglaciecola aquimarina]
MAKNADRPFFLYLSLIQPHANNESVHYDWAHGMEVPSYGQYEDTNYPDYAKGYAAMVSHIDTGVGAIMQQLQSLGIAEDTIVMFSSDNGPHKEGGNDPEFFDSNGQYRGIKRDLYEGGIRVPMIAWGPGTVKAGQRTNHIGYFGDLMATAAEIAGVAPPENTDSISFMPTLTAQSEQVQHDHLYWEFYEWGSKQAIRKGKYKAVRMPMFTGPIEIYDLAADPSEQHNIAASLPTLVAEFKQMFKAAHVPDPVWQVK